MRECRDILAVIFPRSARGRTGARGELVNAAPVGVHDGAGRSARTQVRRVANSVAVLIGFAWWVMSVPMRNQSGARASLRIQVCRSPVNSGGAVGRGADNQRKSPRLAATSGRKK